MRVERGGSRSIEQDPFLDHIVRVNYHSIGLPLYTCACSPDGMTG